jgi:uncharacterized protein YlxW (UPF0749 family)
MSDDQQYGAGPAPEQPTGPAEAPPGRPAGTTGPDAPTTGPAPAPASDPETSPGRSARASSGPASSGVPAEPSSAPASSDPFAGRGPTGAAVSQGDPSGTPDAADDDDRTAAADAADDDRAPAAGAADDDDRVAAPTPENGSDDGDGARTPRRRVTAAGAFIGVLLALLGFALAVQLRSNAGDAQLANERPEDLVQILSDLDSRQERLRLEISNLQTTKQQLQVGSQSREAALQAATQRANELGILAGTLAAQGPGVVIRVQAGQRPVKAATLLDMVEELRDAGAEAMQLDGNGGSVRVVAGTYFVDIDGGRIEADGVSLAAPYTLTAIGDPQTLQPALNIAGGVVDVLHKDGGTVTVTAPGTVRVATTATVTPPKYAKPVK